jgi:Tfp pilus assembly protein PilF
VELDLYGLAEQKYKQVIELDPRDIDAYCCLGKLLIDRGDLVNAGKTFRKALEIDPKATGVQMGIGEVMLRLGHLGKAREFLKHEFELKPQDWETIENLGQLMLDAGMIPEARACFEKLVDEDGNDADYHHGLSVCMFAQGEMEAGMAECERTLSLDPRHVLAMHNMALASAHRRDWLAAKYFLRKARRIAPDDEELKKLRRRISRMRIWSILTSPLNSLLGN